MITNYGKNRATLLLGGSITANLDDFIIGTGSSTITASDTALVTPTDRQSFTSLTFPTSQKVLMQGDWNSVEMSGIQLAEWGIFSQSASETGSTWSRETFTPVTFDGTNELQIEETWEVY